MSLAIKREFAVVKVKCLNFQRRRKPVQIEETCDAAEILTRWRNRNRSATLFSERETLKKVPPRRASPRHGWPRLRWNRSHLVLRHQPRSAIFGGLAFVRARIRPVDRESGPLFFFVLQPSPTASTLPLCFGPPSRPHSFEKSIGMIEALGLAISHSFAQCP